MASRVLVWSGSALAALAVVVVGWTYLKHPDLFRPPVVTTAISILAPVSEAIYGTGTVEPERWAKVVPVQRRRLVELCRCEGQSVKTGQILGRQDDAEEVSALHELEINNEQLERDLNRAEKDRDKSDAAKTEYEQRFTRLEESKSRISAQKVRIDGLVLRAPLDGMVLRRDGEVGEIVGPTDVLFWVGPPAPMQVVAEINEEEITRITVGQKAFLRSEAFATQALRATVSQITPKGDPTRKTFRVYLRLPADTPLRIGMTVEANIVYREKTAAVVVPAEAVTGDTIQVVTGGKVERVPITVGIRGSRNVEIIGNVSKDMTVLSPARTDLADGTRVRVENASLKQATPDAPADTTPGPGTPGPGAARPGATSDPKPAAVVASSVDPDDAVISSALSAHVDSIVNDARRNVGKYSAAR
ncbi:MAG: efflux RND transporter periplasmic adaptor subunit [Bradyrhizobium sp.]|uniref:efflux RND transporter periplasmic adaptor subunit n=1 Tax=Bradyrhizobium sp. TaxID=376 RepID=UPI001211D51D|nr:efflux RND transporter periplasmic adaptor subunit [Bradyrhizobium sp.]THD62665.1 MAG: efflux RND transporter periplasmic adaptor subunit [Bradyrhizobium sp.]